jgi:hypothetical protein
MGMWGGYPAAASRLTTHVLLVQDPAAALPQIQRLTVAQLFASPPITGYMTVRGTPTLGAFPGAPANTQLLIGDTSGFANGGVAVISAAGADAQIAFGNPTTAVRGRLVYHDGNDSLELMSGAGTSLAILGSGGLFTLPQGQIKFPATQNPSVDPNALDDYEEGTWTPSYGAGGGTLTTVTTNAAAYTKKGREITAVLDATLANIGTGAGVFIYTHPFTPAANSAGAAREIAVAGIMGSVFTAGGGNASVAKYDSTGAVVANYRWVCTVTYFG